MNKYKEQVKKKLYKNYFTRMHESEKHYTHTSTRILNERILNTFARNKKKHILDAGCGDGLFIASALQRGFKCEGCDANADLIAVCTRKGYKVRYADLTEKLPYADNTFDGIYCSNVLEHLHEPEFTVHELLRVLKKGGLLIISVPEAHTKVFYNDWTHVKGFTKMTFKSMMRCFDIHEYRMSARYFPIAVRYWNNPLVRIGNWIIGAGPFAWLFTSVFERTTGILRHDLVVEIRK